MRAPALMDPVPPPGPKAPARNKHETRMETTHVPRSTALPRAFTVACSCLTRPLPPRYHAADVPLPCRRHMNNAANVLNAIGGSPDFDNPVSCSTPPNPNSTPAARNPAPPHPINQVLRPRIDKKPSHSPPPLPAEMGVHRLTF